MTNAMPTASPADIFLQRVYQRAFLGAIAGVEKALETGPTGRAPQPAQVVLHEWFEHLPLEDQSQVRAVIREAVRAAVFGCMVILDSASGGFALPGTPSDFALYLQSYPDERAMEENQADAATRLNPANSPAPDLHDQLLDLLAE
jgi:hypothetical protein